MMAPVTSPKVIRLVKLTMLWGVALLWLLDAALQAQPRMFTLDFVSNIMKPSIAISPSFLSALSTWTLQMVSAHIALWNWLFALTQLAIAVSLIVGLLRHHPRLIRAGLLLSIIWGLSVWVFGEGTSGVFTGNGTLFTGAPGSVLLYVVIAAFYFLPDRWWQLSARFCLPRDLLALVFLYGAVAQIATPGFWGSRGIAVLIEGQASMAPSWMVSSMTPLVTFTHAHPALSNAVLAAALLAVGGLLFGRAPKTFGVVLLGISLLFMWYWGQAFGGIFSGMGTDPSTPPVLVLLAIPAAVTWQARRRVAAQDAGLEGPAGGRAEAVSAPQNSALADGRRG
jgi:hypothetical protein